MIARNRPYDEFVRGIVAAAGEWQEAPGHQLVLADPRRPAAPGDRRHGPDLPRPPLQCAKCHHHPYERWGQADYYGLAVLHPPRPQELRRAAAVLLRRRHRPQARRTRSPARPRSRSISTASKCKFTPEEDPRHALVDWMARPDNPFFAKALVNRLWGHFLGRGLDHESTTCARPTRRPIPELLDALAQDFIEHKFDVKHMIRTIVNSRVYQLSSEPTEHNKNDRQNFARYYARRMPAEVFLDAVNQTTGSQERLQRCQLQCPRGRPAARGLRLLLPRHLRSAQARDRLRVRTVHRRHAGQVLLLANSDEIENKIAAGDGRIAKLFKAKKAMPEIVEELYLTAYTRSRPLTEKKRTLAFDR